MPNKKDVKEMKNYHIEGQHFKKGETKYTPLEFETYISEFIIHSFDRKNKTACTVANFIMWMYKKKKYFISETTIKNYKKDSRFGNTYQNLLIAQRCQLENISLFEVIGVPSAIVLMLKNVGYVDRVENLEIEPTIFTIDNKKVE